MKKSLPPRTSKISLDISLTSEFSEAERDLMKWMLFHKVRSGITARLFSNQKIKPNLLEAKEIYTAAGIEERNAIINMAQKLGISKERFDELEKYVYERETQF